MANRTAETLHPALSRDLVEGAKRHDRSSEIAGFFVEQVLDPGCCVRNRVEAGVAATSTDAQPGEVAAGLGHHLSQELPRQRQIVCLGPRDQLPLGVREGMALVAQPGTQWSAAWLCAEFKLRQQRGLRIRPLGTRGGTPRGPLLPFPSTIRRSCRSPRVHGNARSPLSRRHYWAPWNGTYIAPGGHAVGVDDRFETAEAAALSAWAHTPSARARVVEIHQRTPDEVVVVIEVDGNPGYNRDLVTCQRDANGWRWTGSTGAGS